MRNVMQRLAVVIGVILLVPIVFLAFYELHDFRPYFPRINAVYEGMDPEDRAPPVQVGSFVWKVDGQNIDGFAADGLLLEIRHPRRMLTWHYHSFMWRLLLQAHFSKTKRLAFYCHYLPYEHGVGFSKAAQFYFGKQPDALTLDDMAEIVAIGRSPGGNSPTRHPERSQAAKTKLLDAYAAGR